MKRFLFSLALFLSVLALLPSALAVEPEISWARVMDLPVPIEISAHKATGRAPYIAGRPVFDGVDGFTDYVVDFRADHLPIGTYLCVCNFDLDTSSLRKRYASVSRDYPGVAGYCGFQRDLTGRTCVIMTVWDTYCRDRAGNLTVVRANCVYPENAPYERCVGDTTTGEGNFIHCSLDFDWKEGHNYRAALQMYGSRLTFWVMDLVTGRWTLLMEYDLGYENTWITKPIAFLEDFSTRNHGDIRSMVLFNFRVRDRKTGRWVGTHELRFHESYEYRGSYAYGAQGNAFYAITTNIEGRCAVPPQNQLYRVSACDGSAPY